MHSFPAFQTIVQSLVFLIHCIGSQQLKFFGKLWFRLGCVTLIRFLAQQSSAYYLNWSIEA